jgi:hypothetical protein
VAASPSADARNRLVSLIIAALPCLILIGTSGALACSPAPPNLSIPEKFAKASAVFAARIFRTEEVFGKGIEATFRVIEIFKGQPPSDQKVRSMEFRPGACGFPLMAGIDHLFFLAEGQTDVWLNNDSARAFVAELPHGQKLLAELRALKK